MRTCAGPMMAFGILLATLPASGQDFLPSPMQVEWEAHRFLPWDPDPPVPFVVAAPLGAKPAIQVMGYLPYWEVGKATLHLDQLTILAYFAAAVGSDGSLTDTHHWGTSTMTKLVDEAHAAGVKVVLTATNFDKAQIHAILANPQPAIDGLVKAVKAQGGDGVNIDFEGLQVADKAAMVTFMGKLKKAMDAALGESHVTAASPAVDWSGAWDFDAIEEACDGFMIMGYDYHWSGGQPGPVSPLVSSAKWGSKSLQWTIDDYLTDGGPENRDLLIVGIPLYGFDWAAEGPQIPGAAKAKGKAVFLASCLSMRKRTAGTFGTWNRRRRTTSTRPRTGTRSGAKARCRSR